MLAFFAAPLAALLLVTPAFALPSPRCTLSRRVVSGDNCYSIAESGGISIQQLFSFNPTTLNSSCSNLQVGNQYCVAAPRKCIARPVAPPAAPTCVTSYTVKSGDYCSKIATTFSITTAQLIARNPSINSGCSNLQIGQVLCVSALPVSCPSNAVRSGSTCRCNTSTQTYNLARNTCS